MQVFISHRSKDKPEAEKIKDYLQRCFIKTWLDKDELKVGDELTSSFLSGIEGNVTLALLSEEYIDSDWCREEFMISYNQWVRKKGEIFPVVMGNDALAERIYEKAKQTNFSELTSVMNRLKYILYDKNYFEKSCNEIAEAVQRNNPIRMQPIRLVEVEGKKMQFLSYEFDRHPPVPTTVFQAWQTNTSDFIDFKKDGSLPLREDMPLIIPLKGTGWMQTYFLMPLAGKFVVYFYIAPENSDTVELLCVYAPEHNRALVGSVTKLKERL